MTERTGELSEVVLHAGTAGPGFGRAECEVSALDGRGLVAVIPDPTPVVPGYMRKYPGMTPDELGEMQHRLAAAARKRGYVLGTVHVEELPTEPQAFDALLTSLKELDAPAIVVPTFAHIGTINNPASKYSRLRIETTAEIIIAEFVL